MDAGPLSQLRSPPQITVANQNQYNPLPLLTGAVPIVCCFLFWDEHLLLIPLLVCPITLGLAAGGVTIMGGRLGRQKADCCPSA